MVRFGGSRSRRVLLWGVLLFGTTQAGLGEFLSRQPQYRDRPFDHKLHLLRQLRACHPDRPLVLFLGSSRTACGVRPDTLQTQGKAAVFNFGEVGAGPFSYLLYLKRLLCRGIRPQYLFVEVWPAALMNPGAQVIELSRLAERPLEAGDLRVLRRYWLPVSFWYPRWLVGRFLPAYAWRGALRRGWGDDSEPAPELHILSGIDACGWHVSDEAPAGCTREQVRERIRPFFEPGLRSLVLSPLADLALRELLTICRQENIAVTMVFFPEAEFFRAWYQPAALSAMQNYLDSLTRDLGVPWIDARGWIDDTGFTDGFHLNRSGATRFTQQLEQTVLRPVFADQFVPACQPTEGPLRAARTSRTPQNS